MFSALNFLDSGGEMGRRIRDHDWSGNPAGMPRDWPQPLRFALNICMGSSFPTAIYWGPELRLFYNDAWAHIPAERHPWALGQRGRDVFPEIWDILGPQFERVMRTGEGFAAYDQRLDMFRDGRTQETYWNYSFTPIRDEYGAVVGILNQGNETTRAVMAERARLAEVERLRDLFEQAPGAVALLHGRDHVFEIANDAYLDLVGRRDVLGLSVADALPEVVNQGFVALLDEVFERGEAHRGWAVPVAIARGDDGVIEERLIDFVYQPIKDPNGNVTDIFVEATDVTDRARAEQRLRATEERLELALHSSIGIGIWDWDVQRDRVVADRRFATLYGVDPERAARGVPIGEFLSSIHPSDVEALGAAIDQAVETGAPYTHEYRIVQPDGAVRWVSTHGQCARDDRGQPTRFLGVAFDITERVRAEEMAREVAEELRAATDTQAFVYALAEQQRVADNADAIMESTSRALGERLGLDRVGFFRVGEDRALEFGPSWSSDRLPPITGTIPAGEMGTAVRDQYALGKTVIIRDAANDPLHGDTPLARLSPAGIGVPLLRHGRWVASLYVSQAEPRDWTNEEIAFIEGIAEISWDAVERVEAVGALVDSEAKFRGIVNSIEQMIWSTRPDGYHDYYNDRWYEYTGTPHGSTDGEGWNGMFHPEDQDRAWARWSHSLATGEPYQIEYRLRHRSGEYRWVMGRAHPVRDDRGRITRWFGTCTDIQEIVDAREVLNRSRAQLEAAVEERTHQLMAAEEQLRQAQKMEAVGQLTGGIAHDFNNMLAVVLGALDLLERRLARGETDLSRYVDAARDGAQRAAALTQRLLSFARQQPLAPVSIDPNHMLRGMTDLLTRTLGEGVRVETALDPDCWRARADPSQLENCIINLSVNARDAMPRGGLLTIRTANRSIERDDAQIMGLPPGDYVELSVSDTGEGMAEDVAQRAFEPFFTTKDVGKGTGLGLSQVFGFVRQSGGHVSIDTTQGQGTTVRLILPRDAAEAVGDASEDRRTAPRGGGETILLVEDEERVRTFSAEALRDLGYRVIEAADGAEALSLIDRGASIDLLFTDVIMPGMTGRELADHAAERIDGLRVLYTSGYTRDAIARRDGDATLTERDVLAKPFGVDALAHRVRDALDSTIVRA
jgi:PAS domain S-box-containing protein